MLIRNGAARTSGGWTDNYWEWPETQHQPGLEAATASAKLALHEGLEDAGLRTFPGGVRVLVELVIGTIAPIVAAGPQRRRPTGVLQYS